MVQSLHSHYERLSNLSLQLLETHNNRRSTSNVNEELIQGSKIKSQNHFEVKIDEVIDLSKVTNKYKFIYSLKPRKIVVNQIDYILSIDITNHNFEKEFLYIPSRIIILISQLVTIMSSGTREIAIK